MKKTSFFSVILLFCSFLPLAYAENSLQITAHAEQGSIKAGMMFLVKVQVSSATSQPADFWSYRCSYEKHWVTDHPIVFIQSWTCAGDDRERIVLKPGELYEKKIIVYIPKKDKTEPVGFRLGFKRMAEDGQESEPVWSNPVNIQVIVPEQGASPQTVKNETLVKEQAQKEEEDLLGSTIS